MDFNQNETPKLPLELIGVILLNYDDDDESALEEMKKCRLISPRWYKGVQDLFRDEFSEKFQSHFDGSQQSFASSRSFGFNIFGFYRLNFPTLKISNSEFYLLKTFLKRLILTNLTTLELTDNLIVWTQLLDILAKFQNMTKFIFIQTSKNIEVAEKIFKNITNDLVPQKISEDINIDIEDDSSSSRSAINLGNFVKQKAIFDEVLEKIQNHLKSEDGFLKNLKSIQFSVVHIELFVILNIIISCSECQLESMSYKFSLTDMFKIWELNKDNYFSYPNNETINYTLYLYHLNKFSESMKNIEMILENWPAPEWFGDDGRHFEHLICYWIFNIFSNDNKSVNFVNFKNVQRIYFAVPLVFTYRWDSGLFDFIMNQVTLKELYISEIFKIQTSDSIYIEKNIANQVDPVFDEILKKIKPGCQTHFGFNLNLPALMSLQKIPQNLVFLRWDNCNRSINFIWEPHYFPIFSNCNTLLLENSSYQNHNVTFLDIQLIVDKFPNLNILKIQYKTDLLTWFTPTRVDERPQVSDEDLQLIIRFLKVLEELVIVNCSRNISDIGLTGLTNEAVELRKTNPDLPIEPVDALGLPISHLKKLERLVITSSVDPLSRVTDISARFGFDKMTKLRQVAIIGSNGSCISQDGCEILKEKTMAKNLKILLQN